MPTTIKTNAAGTLAELLLNATSVAQFSQNAVTFPQLAQSLTPNGYVKLPGGLIVQWGYDGGGAEVRTIPFAIAFPTNCFNVQVTLSMADPGASVTVAVQSITQSSFGISRLDSGATMVEPFFWIAIGY